MIKIFLLLITIFNLYADDTIVQTKENVLRIQNMIELEEKIAENYEKYLLNEFTFPSMENLVNDTYLGSNFSVVNKFGSENISFIDSSKNDEDGFKIKYAVTNNVELYVKELYERDLYRINTHAYKVTDKAYVLIKLKSKEAQNIYRILKSGFLIAKTCSDSLKNSYCSYDSSTIRWYNSASNWIEYSKKDFEDGNVTIVNSNVIFDTKLNNLKVGAYIYIENSAKYVKIIDNKILKVD
jgi:hypothetical protein